MPRQLTYDHKYGYNYSHMKRIDDCDYVSIADTKATLSEKIKRCNEPGRTFAITNHGKPVAVLLSYKQFLGLINQKTEQKEPIKLNDWLKEQPERDKIIQSVSALFNTKILSRKGQKKYKNDIVKQFRKN